MATIDELEELFNKKLRHLSAEELFEYKKKYDKWWKEALERVNSVGEPVKEDK